MPAVEGEIYGLFSPTLVWAASTIGIVVAGFSVYFAVQYLRKYLAIQAQSRVANPHKPNAGQIINDAINKIEQFYNQAHVGDITVSDAGELVSAVSREAFDMLMNHRTRYSSRLETRSMNLETIAVAQDIAYPIEFDQIPKDIAQLRTFCDKSKEIVSSCA